MCDRHHQTLQIYLSHRGKSFTQLKTVSVAVHRCDRRESLQFRQEVERPDIPRVKDVIHLGEDIEDFSAEQTVSVCYDPDPHRLSLPARRHLDIEPHIVQDSLDQEID